MKKQLKMRFISKKGNQIMITETDISTGQAKHYIKVNGIHDKRPFSTKELISIMA